MTWGFATDDSHWKHGAEGRGWVMVRTSDFTPNGLVAALRRGLFYSSMGPEILDLRVEDGAVRVSTSPAARINFIAARARGSSQRAGPEPLTAAAHELRGEEIVRPGRSGGCGGPRGLVEPDSALTAGASPRRASERLRSGYAAARTMTANLPASRLAPPTSAPSIPSRLSSSAQFSGVTLPPY